MTGPLEGLLGAARRGPAALSGAFGLLSRADDETSETLAGEGEVARLLESLESSISPLAGEIRELRAGGRELHEELERTRGELEGLQGTARELARTMAQLEGSLDHLLDRVPGLSADDARERAQTREFDRDPPGGER